MNPRRALNSGDWQGTRKSSLLPMGRGEWIVLYRSKKALHILFFLGNNFNTELMFEIIQIVRFKKQNR